MTEFALIDPTSGERVLFYWLKDGVVGTTLSTVPSITLEAGETPEQALSRAIGTYGTVTDLGKCISRKIETPRGECHFRMARPDWTTDGRTYFPLVDDYASEVANLRGQLVNLMRLLQGICAVVHPSDDTFTTYGHEIRNLILLAATEVEAHWRSVLQANAYAPSKDRFNTNDYVRLLKPLRLDEYEVTLIYFPWLKPFNPFLGWSASDPTKTLAWYDAYNAIKHDRERNFQQANLQHAFNSVVACAVMLVAQVGLMEAFRYRMEFGYFFYFSKKPKWEATEGYLPPSPGVRWKGVNFSF